METTQTAAGESKIAGANQAPAPLELVTPIQTSIKVPEVEQPKPLLYFGNQVLIGSRKVQIIRVEHFNLIPKTPQAKAIQDEVTLKIGSQWKKGTRDIIRGLTPEEEKKYLPTILGVSATSEKWEERVLTHWADFSIQIPNSEEGIVLEAGYKIQTLSNGDKEIIPILLDDYMKYNFCRQNGKVADEGEDNIGLFDFRLVDRARKQREEEQAFNAKKGIEGTYLSLIKSTDPTQRVKIDWILETIGGEYGEGISISGLTPIQKEMELEKVKNKNFEKFNEVITDPDLQIKSLLRKALGAGSLDLQGTTYFLGNKAIGSLKETISYYRDPVNVKDRQLLEISIK